MRNIRSHLDDNPFGHTPAARPTWETARPEPPPRRRANSLQHVSTAASPNIRATRLSLFNTTVVCVAFLTFSVLMHFASMQFRAEEKWRQCNELTVDWQGTVLSISCYYGISRFIVCFMTYLHKCQHSNVRCNVLVWFVAVDDVLFDLFLFEFFFWKVFFFIFQETLFVFPHFINSIFEFKGLLRC